MRTGFTPLVVALAAIFTLCSQGRAAATPPVEAFGALPAIASPAMAPDGKHYALVLSGNGKSLVAIYEVDAPEGARPAFVAAGDGRIYTIGWVNPNRLVVILKANMRANGDSQIRTWWRSVSVNAQGKEPAVLLNNVPSMQYNFSAAYIAGTNLADPNHVFMPLVASNNGQTAVVNLYRVDVNTGAAELWHAGTIWTANFIMDGNGRVAARIDTYVRELKYHIKTYDGHDWNEFAAFDLTNGGDAHVAGVTQDGNGLAMEMPSPAKTVGLFRIDLASKAVTQLYADPKFDVLSELHDEWTGHVIGVATVDDSVRFTYFDPVRQRIQTALERTFAGRTVTISTCDAQVHLCIVSTSAPRHPADYFLLDVATLHATPLGSAYPQLAEADLGEMKPYNYSARDGMPIPGYLTLPPGRPATNLPLVVMPHGGPDARDYISFDWWAQFLASRGYAVLQPNFRGSSGYGAAFTAAGAHQWGLKMQDDLADGVAKLTAEGIVDPKRVCIVGASYGGYAALAGVAFSQGVYACAASFAGVFDLDEMLRTEERWTGDADVSSVVSFWQSRIGNRHNSADEARIIATSPALHADQIQVPVLLLHANADQTVPIAQSRRMRDALERAHKRVQYIEITGDDHHIDLAETRIKLLGEIEKFLAANIGSPATQ